MVVRFLYNSKWKFKMHFKKAFLYHDCLLNLNHKAHISCNRFIEKPFTPKNKVPTPSPVGNIDPVKSFTKYKYKYEY